jgi:hypothetical protein
MLDLDLVNARIREYYLREGYTSWPEALDDIARTYTLLGHAVDEIGYLRSVPNDLATLARAYLDVATFPSWNAGDCRFCGLFGEHAHDCAYGRTEKALLYAVSLPTAPSTSEPISEDTQLLAHTLHAVNDAATLRLELAQMKRDVERASSEIDDLRNALEAQSRTVVHQRRSLEEAEEELGRGELMHALAAIGRGLNEGSG